MSASLVGSEMCIRDRSPSLPSLGRNELTCNDELDCGSPDCGLAECGAVSYTHLTLPTICSV
eukprot:10035370-Alexandrium_andersonii.AAC.1